MKMRGNGQAVMPVQCPYPNLGSLHSSYSQSQWLKDSVLPRCIGAVLDLSTGANHMNTVRFRFAKNEYWEAQITLNASLFFEADRLEAAAYVIIADGFDSPEVWKRFTEAKKAAEEKRQVAWLDWMRIQQAWKE